MKTLQIPERFWKTTLKQLRINFEVGPGIFPQDEIRLNLPMSNEYGWMWLEKRKNELRDRYKDDVLAFPHHLGYPVGSRGVNWKSYSPANSPLLSTDEDPSSGKFYQGAMR